MSKYELLWECNMLYYYDENTMVTLFDDTYKNTFIKCYGIDKLRKWKIKGTVIEN